jgi:hypothetical protein
MTMRTVRVASTGYGARGSAAYPRRDGGQRSAANLVYNLGYSYAAGDSDRLQSALRRIRPGHATMTIASVQLVDVLFRQVPVDGHLAWDLSWDHVATIPLKGKPC